MTEDLEEFLLSDGQPEGFDHETFVINDDAEALWAMRSLAGAQRKIDAIEATANVERERINSWVEYATKSSRTTVIYFETALTAFALRKREEGVKSLSFPDGYVKSRATQAKVVVEEMDEFLEWVDSTGHGGWTRTKRDVDAAAMKRDVILKDGLVIDEFTGEVVPGVSSVPAGVSVSVIVSE